VCVLALVIRYAKRIRRVILLSVACPALQYFSTLSQRHYCKKKKLLNIKSVQLLPETFLTIQRDITIVHRSSCKVPVILVRF